MVNFGLLTAEIWWRVWGTPANFKGFRVLAALLHGTLVVGVSQTLRHWTEGATCIRQGGHHIGHWPIFLVLYTILKVVLSEWYNWVWTYTVLGTLRHVTALVTSRRNNGISVFLHVIAMKIYFKFFFLANKIHCSNSQIRFTRIESAINFTSCFVVDRPREIIG